MDALQEDSQDDCRMGSLLNCLKMENLGSGMIALLLCNEMLNEGKVVWNPSALQSARRRQYNVFLVAPVSRRKFTVIP